MKVIPTAAHKESDLVVDQRLVSADWTGAEGMEEPLWGGSKAREEKLVVG